MQKLNQYKYIMLILLVVLGLAFYWYEYRPSKIIEKCSKVRGGYISNLGKSETTQERSYKNCLRRGGLE